MANTNTGLTASERRMLELAVRGLSNKEIAAELGLATPTVKNGMVRVYEALGVETRTQAALEAVRRGLVALNPDEPARDDTAALLARTLAALPDEQRATLAAGVRLLCAGAERGA